MGNASVALYDEVASVYYNPGALGQLTDYGVHFTHSLWLADITYDYAAAFLQAGSFGNLFFNLIFFKKIRKSASPPAPACILILRVSSSSSIIAGRITAGWKTRSGLVWG